MIIAGKDKGKTGTVERVHPRANKVFVSGMNTVTKHQKSRRVRSRGQIIEKSAPIDASNVALMVDGKPVRIGYEVEHTGTKKTKVRIARPSGKKI